MEYPILALIFFISLLLTLILFLGVVLRPPLWRKNSKKIKVFYATWFTPYLIFILFFTGPEDL
jgi:uncharacterized membrane protein